MKQILIVSVLVLLLGAEVHAQQSYLFTQYQQNQYLINSATAGLHNYTDVNLSIRKQWVGINYAPTTAYVSINTPIGKPMGIDPTTSSTRTSGQSDPVKSKKSFHAIGVTALKDSYGPFSETQLKASYAFHLPLTKRMNVSFSPNASFVSKIFNTSLAQPEILSDPTYFNYTANAANANYLNIDYAFWLYRPLFYIGYSTENLINKPINNALDMANRPLNHHRVIFGRKIRANKNLLVTPSAMLRIVNNAPISADFNLRIDYNDRLWAGVTFRNDIAVLAMFGTYINNTIKIGYSYDYSFTAIQSQSLGSHELFIGLNLFNREKALFRNK